MRPWSGFAAGDREPNYAHRLRRLWPRIRHRQSTVRWNIIMADPLELVLLVPLLAAAMLVLVRDYRAGAIGNIAACGVTLLCAALLVVERPAQRPYLLVDDLNVVFILLNSFVGFTTSIFSASYIAHELQTGRLTRRHLRFYHAMFQLMLFGMNLALVANNIGLMWVAVELATLTTVVMVGLYRTHEALEAAWKYFILGSVGIALALFGTILVYLAARPVVGEGMDAMVWTTLIARAQAFDPPLLNIAFIFLLLGYGTKVGLAPLHAWLPDAHAEGPTPISAVLSGLLLNVALYALLRFKMLLTANPGAIAPGPLMIGLGMLSVLFSAVMLYRRRDIKRLFAYSSIEHMGIIVFAFGMAGPLGNFAGLLQMTMHSLTKSAIFFSVGYVSQVKGSQRIADIGGLTESHAMLGWGLVTGVVAIVGLPPFGVFTSEFLLLTSTFAHAPILAAVLTAGLLLAFGALLLRLNDLAFGPVRGPVGAVQASYLPMFAHLLLVLAAGIWLPAPMVAWFQHVAILLG
jgi:hydrogenase-4 component F